MTNGYTFVVGEGPEGEGYIAFSQSEPVFCFIRNTKDEAIEAACRALDSYIENFRQTALPELDVDVTVPVHIIASQTAHNRKVAA